ncbi:dynactin p62 family-domain-containing protein [Umbelopsis sp. PMI_123]|nr:dynactin p62 family-domain-containing protein [Umbelopsis sp. PMI_123]
MQPANPFVYYHCTCPDFYQTSGRSLDASGSRDAANDPSSTDSRQPYVPFATSSATDSDFSLFPLSRLYFCEDCHQIRCPSCVQDEVISYYCPNCLFEVPTASVKSEKNRCARNCFQCPICQNTLTAVANPDIPPRDPAASEDVTKPAVNPYHLFCGVCRWDSQEVGITFEKPTSLAMQLQKSEDASPDIKEFDHLKEHFEKFLRYNTPQSLPTSFLSLSSSGSFSKMGYNTSMQNRKSNNAKMDDVGEYKASEYIPHGDMAVMDNLINIQEDTTVSSLEQRFNQVYDQPYDTNKLKPQRIHLRIKRSKRCRTCRHILIKPEQKAQATRFKIKLVAMNYIPNITMQMLPRKTLPLRQNVPTQLILKFTNPLYEEISVTLATPQQHQTKGDQSGTQNDLRKPWGRVTLLSPHFTVGAYNETIEYDDELLYGKPSALSTPAAAAWENGVYEKKNNYTSILIEVVPEYEGEFKFPLLVNYSYKSDEDQLDTGYDDDDDADDADEAGHKQSQTLDRQPEERTKTYSFWCVVGLGEVVQ